MKSIMCSALLWALFLPSTVFGNGVCTRPEELIGKRERAEAQVALAREHGTYFRYASSAESNESISSLVERGGLVKITGGMGYYVDGIGSGCGHYPHDVVEYLFYARVEVSEFLAYVGERFDKKFPGEKLKIAGLSRTEFWQEKLLLQCGVTSVRYSPHQWGFALDFSKKDMSAKEMCFLWDELLSLQEKNLVTAVDERTNIHVMVHPSFLEWKTLQERPVYTLPVFAFITPLIPINN